MSTYSYRTNEIGYFLVPRHGSHRPMVHKNISDPKSKFMAGLFNCRSIDDDHVTVRESHLAMQLLSGLLIDNFH